MMSNHNFFHIKILIVAVAMWELCDALAPKGVAFATPAFIFCGGLSVVSAAISLIFYSNLSLSVNKDFLSLLLLMSAVALISGFYQLSTNYPYSSRHFAVDILIFPLLLMLAALFPKAVIDKFQFKDVCSLMGATFISAFLSPVFANLNLLPDYAWAGRYDPPSYIATSLLATYIVFGREPWRRFLCVCLFSLFLGLAAQSGSRTGLILSALPLAIAFILSSKIKSGSVSRIALLSLGFLITATLAAGPLISDQIDLRALQLVSISSDASLLGRVYEAIDVTAAYAEGDAIQILVGFGPGSLWAPTLTDTTAVTRDLFSGYVYYIHIGPIAFLFRYGLVGLFFFVWLAMLCVRIYKKIQPKSSGQLFRTDLVSIASFLILLSILINWLFRASANDFTAILALAFASSIVLRKPESQI